MTPKQKAIIIQSMEIHGNYRDYTIQDLWRKINNLKRGNKLLSQREI